MARRHAILLAVVACLVLSPAARGAEDGTFDILVYNIFARPYVVSHDGQVERIQRIGPALARLEQEKGLEIDAIAFAELFRPEDVDTLRRALPGWHHTPVETTLSGQVAGAVVIFSRWPIEASGRETFGTACTGGDCFGEKGVVYAAVAPKRGPLAGTTAHIFATHLQAWEQNADIRREQFRIISDYIQSRQIAAGDPVWVVGDLNVDYWSDRRKPAGRQELRRAVEILGAVYPTVDEERKYTSDPHMNLLVGRDGAASECEDAYERGWGRREEYDPPRCGTFDPRSIGTYYVYHPPPRLPAGRAYCPCCPAEWLDYLLPLEAHRLAAETTVEAVVLRVPEPFRMPWSGKLEPDPAPTCGDLIVQRELSDHYPVLGRFRF